jgi:hypothetical protein
VQIREYIMSGKRQFIPIAGLLATVLVVMYVLAQLHGQTAAPSGDFTNAAVAEVRDPQGQVILRGDFQVADEDDDDIERKAVLAPVGTVADASGEAEVEFSRTAPAVQEIEFSVRNVAPGTSLAFVIDGTQVATAVSNARGRADVELKVRMAAAAAAP